MVLDKSGSMGNYNRLDRLKKAASRFIKFDIKDGTPLGVVQFSSSAKIIHLVTPIKDSNRNYPINKINNLSAEGGTCLGDGLLKGLKALKDYDKRDGGVMIFLTDGEFQCNGGPNIPQVINRIVAQNVRVVTIAFSNNADPNIE